MSRQVLKNIAQGLLNSFISRNNDVNGYWGIGKLYTLMLNKSINKVEIDLLNISISPSNDEFQYRISKYSEELLNKLYGKKLNKNIIKSAKIVLICSDITISKSLLNNVKCKIIIDNNEKQITFNNEVYCRKHNPKVELKRVE